MDVFVYGTLTAPETADRVLDRYAFRGDAVLEGLHHVDGDYPTLVPGGSCAGRLLRTPSVAALDRYEGVDRGLYVRQTIPVDGGDTVECYIGHPDRLGVADEWPGVGAFDDRVAAYLRDHDVRVRRPSA